MQDTFPSMKSLLANVREDGNYEFEICTLRESAVKLFAPHGGCIEPGTAPIVKALAGLEYDYFIFRAIRRGGGCRKLLHVTSAHYDEERCQSMSRAALLSLSVHGCKGSRKFIEVGGGNRAFAGSLYDVLRKKYSVKLRSGNRDGSNPQNFINIAVNQGVQLELSEGFRNHLFVGYPRSMARHPETFPEFIRTVRAWLREIEHKLRPAA